jgi:hypothetical protein
MAKRIEEIFEECLERIEQGESIESCLASYPDEAEELVELLTTFVNVKWRTTMVEPRPEFKAWGKAQLFNVYNQRAYQTEKEVRHSGIFSLQRIWVPALAGLIIFVLLGGVGTAAASNSAMPDQPLYSVKLATEEVRLALSFSDEDKAVVNAEIAQRRAQEIAAMAELGKTEYIAVTTERMLNNLNEAEQAVDKVLWGEENESVPQALLMSPDESAAPAPSATAADSVGTGDAEINKGVDDEHARSYGASSDDSVNTRNERVKQTFEASVSNNLSVLEDTLDKVPESAKSTIQNAIDVTKSKKERITNTINNQWQDRNNNGIPDVDEIEPDESTGSGTSWNNQKWNFTDTGNKSNSSTYTRKNDSSSNENATSTTSNTTASGTNTSNSKDYSPTDDNASGKDFRKDYNPFSNWRRK